MKTHYRSFRNGKAVIRGCGAAGLCMRTREWREAMTKALPCNHAEDCGQCVSPEVVREAEGEIDRLRAELVAWKQDTVRAQAEATLYRAALDDIGKQSGCWRASKGNPGKFARTVLAGGWTP